MGIGTKNENPSVKPDGLSTWNWCPKPTLQSWLFSPPTLSTSTFAAASYVKIVKELTRFVRIYKGSMALQKGSWIKGKADLVCRPKSLLNYVTKCKSNLLSSKWTCVLQTPIALLRVLWVNEMALKGYPYVRWWLSCDIHRAVVAVLLLLNFSSSFTHSLNHSTNMFWVQCTSKCSRHWGYRQNLGPRDT